MGEREQGAGQMGRFGVAVDEEFGSRRLFVGGYCAIWRVLGPFSIPYCGCGLLYRWRCRLFGFPGLRRERSGRGIFAQYIFLVLRSVEQIVVVAVGFKVVQSVSESFDQGALSGEGGLGRGFLGGELEG